MLFAGAKEDKNEVVLCLSTSLGRETNLVCSAMFCVRLCHLQHADHDLPTLVLLPWESAG